MASLNPISGTLGRRRAAHLLRRATFGPSKQEINQFASLTADQAIAQLFQVPTAPPPPSDTATGLPWVTPKPTEANSEDFELRRYVNCWWLEQMKVSGGNSCEKLTFFWHTHFTTKQSLVGSTRMYYQNALLRYYALGNFRDLTKNICLDNAMLRFLDGRLNDKNNPNENFARELLELYTIGKGPQIGPENYTNYTETDVREAARVLSGYEDDNDFLNPDIVTGIPMGIVKSNGLMAATAHDATPKNFTNPFPDTTIIPNQMVGEDATVDATLDELDQLLNMIFGQAETARHLCRKFYRFFMYYEITTEIEQDIIEPLANTFRSNNYEVQPVLQQLFRSQHFYDADNALVDDDNHGAIIKSPLDLVMGTLRFFEINLPDSNTDLAGFYDAAASGILAPMQQQGLDLYEPFEVAGYKAYHQFPGYNRNWISENNLARRYQYSDLLLEGEQRGWGFWMDTVAYVDNPQHISDPANAQTLLQELVDDLFPEIITQERFDYFLNDILLDGLSMANWSTEWFAYKSSGDNSAVKSQLDSLFRALLQSPEYQLK